MARLSKVKSAETDRTGERIYLTFVGESGSEVEISLPHEQTGALILAALRGREKSAEKRIKQGDREPAAADLQVNRVTVQRVDDHIIVAYGFKGGAVFPVVLDMRANLNLIDAMEHAVREVYQHAKPAPQTEAKVVH